MYFKNVTLSAVLSAAAIVCALFSGDVAAKDYKVSVAIPVSTEGLDLSQPADVQTFYTRLKNAAWVACTRGDRVNLAPPDNLTACYEKALGGAIRSANVPSLTQLYLANHTLQQAVAFHIPVPAQIAAK